MRSGFMCNGYLRYCSIKYYTKMTPVILDGSLQQTKQNYPSFLKNEHLLSTFIITTDVYQMLKSSETQGHKTSKLWNNISTMVWLTTNTLNFNMCTHTVWFIENSR